MDLKGKTKQKKKTKKNRGWDKVIHMVESDYSHEPGRSPYGIHSNVVKQP